MKLQTFINRPILACVISVLILLVGLIGLANLPMEQYPDIAPPTVMVSTTYTGANAETVQKSVVVPLEEAINGVEDMIYMTSTSTNTGAGDITVYFKQGTDPDMATINTKNRVSEAEGLLPAEVTQIGVTVEKRQNSMLKSSPSIRPMTRTTRHSSTTTSKSTSSLGCRVSAAWETSMSWEMTTPCASGSTRKRWRNTDWCLPM